MEDSVHTATAPLPAPVGESARVASLDLLRGFALLGILVMNIQGFSMPEAAYLNPTVWGDLTGANLGVWILGHLLADQKMMAIFSMLFGAGIVLFTDRAAAKGRSPVRLHYRRSFWLLLFGAAHGYLLWFGDILFLYAVCAFGVVWFRHWPPRRLLIVGVLLLSVATAVNVTLGVTFPSWPPAEQAAILDELWNPTPELLAAEVEAYRGGWLRQMEKRVPATFTFQTFVLAIWGIWRAGGMMLVGMGLFKLGVFSAQRSDAFYGRMVLAGALIGLPLVALGIRWNFANAWGPTSFFFGGQFNYWGSLLVSLGWVGAVMLLYRKRTLAWLQGALAAVGRTAFSNYILQTVLCTTLFYGHGFGLFGSVERTGQVAVVLAIWVLQLIASPLWLRRFRFGPLEWLWRSLTYGEFQPIRRS